MLKVKNARYYCGSWAWYNNTKKERSPFFCGSGTCSRDRCKEAFSHKRITLISDLVNEYKLNKFFTLTLDRAKIPEEKAWMDISFIWNKCRTVLTRKYVGMNYLAVLEAHKNDAYPHIHGFTDKYIDQAVLSWHWDACGGGRVVDIRKVDDKKIASYVSKELNAAKYVGKNNIVGAKQRVRRTFWRSTKMKSKRELTESDEDWLLIKSPIYVDGEERIDGNAECKGKDLESAFRAIPSSGAQVCEQNLEA